MSERRLIDLWEAPSGVRLVSAIATSYELDADFLEEDLLPAALGLRLPPGRGREFRLELEHALQDTEVSIFFDPERYRPGLRRSPRIDLIALPEGRFPKLHAKVALLRFVDAENPEPRHQIVRLVVGSANLTTPGYRTNIEVAAALDDAPDAAVEAVTAVRDALDWLETLVADETGQVAHQIRDLRAVFASRSLTRSDQRLRFGFLRGIQIVAVETAEARAAQPEFVEGGAHTGRFVLPPVGCRPGRMKGRLGRGQQFNRAKALIAGPGERIDIEAGQQSDPHGTYSKET